MVQKNIDIIIIFAFALVLGACTPQAEATVEAPVLEVPAEEAAVEQAETAGGSTSEAVELTDGLGRSITLELPAQRIISLAPSNTEILFAIGAGDQIIARDIFSDFPEEAFEITDIGGGWGDIDVETILTLDADLVFAADLTAPEQIQALEDLGLTVYALQNPTDLPGMYENLRTAAMLTGHETEAETLIESLQARVAAVEEKVAGVTETPTLFYELDATDPNAPWTSGPGTFIDTLISMAGGSNVGSVLDGAWAQINLEELIAQDPDIILLGDFLYGGIIPEAVAARPGWEGLSAVKNGQVFTFNDNFVGRPGPRLVDGLEELAKFLHPDLFE